MRINQYPKTTTLDDKDVFVVETSDGTKQIEKADMDKLISPNEEIYDAATTHRSVYRGKNLGTEFTEAQKKAIREGTFDDIYVGDYWVDGAITWRVVDIDYFATNDRHLVIMPDDPLVTVKPYTADNNTGYAQSNMRTVCDTTCKEKFASFFSNENIMEVSQREATTMTTFGLAAFVYTTISADTTFNCSVMVPDPFLLCNDSLVGRFIKSFPYTGAFSAFILNKNLIRSNTKYVTKQKSLVNSAATSTTIMIVNEKTNSNLQDLTSQAATTEVGIRPYAIIKG